MSRRAWQRIVDGYEQWDPEAMFKDNVCLHVVSKVMKGIAQTEKEDRQECPERCTTLKRFGEYRMEIGSGSCDSEMSRKMLNGQAEGELVAAYADADAAGRGGMSGRVRWQGDGATIVGRTLVMVNAGTHHDPLRDCEECHTPGHAEGWLRGAVVDGDCTGARVNGAISYNFEQGGEQTEFYAVLEGLLIIQCDDD